MRSVSRGFRGRLQEILFPLFKFLEARKPENPFGMPVDALPELVGGALEAVEPRPVIWQVAPADDFQVYGGLWWQRQPQLKRLPPPQVQAPQASRNRAMTLVR